jgi:dipeptidyl aminopeptidase/acylaminoacyl peptidase
MKYLLTFLLGLLAPGLGTAQFSIEQILSAPFPTQLTAASWEETLAWVFNDRGVRNVFIATGPDLATVRPLTDFAEDDGVEIGDLTFTPDDRYLLYVRGNTPNRGGEAANPAQLPAPPERTLYLADLDGGTTRNLGPGYGPVVAPAGDRLLFRRSGKVWLANLADTTQAPRQLFDLRGGENALRWRPDGTQVAFVSSRGDHSFIGIYDFATDRVTFPDPSADIDSEPVWSPDGSRLAYVRRPNVRVRPPFTPQREGYPWSIRVLDVATATVEEVWRAEPGPGSVFIGNLPVVENKLWWAAGDQIVFPWERGGWIRLYALDLASGTTRLLTPGDGEVENVTLSKDRRTLFYSSNSGDAERRHLWRTEIASGRATQLTAGDGVEWSPVQIVNGSLALLRSTAQRPAWPHILRTRGPEPIAETYFPADFPTSLVTPTTITVTATDGMEVPAQLFLPPGHTADREYPAAIFLHGGSRRQMLPAFHYSQYYSHAYALNQYLASRGFVVMALNYRSGIGYGLEFREAEAYGITGASEVRDLIGAGEYLRDRADVAGDRIGLWGGSYGGYLTAHGLAQRGDLFAAGVDIHGVHNWNDELPTFASWYDSTRYDQIGQLAYRSSPEYYVDGWENPVLFIHGDDDRNVPFSETVHLLEKLRERGVATEQLIFPDEVHGFLLHRNWLAAYRATAAFLERHLRE